MHKLRKLHGNEFRSLKSCNCIAFEKSKVMYFRLGHLLESSCRIGDVTSSHGNSMYLSVGPNRTLMRAIRFSKLFTWRPLNSGRRETTCQSWWLYASRRHFLQTRATLLSSRWWRNENTYSRHLSGRLSTVQDWKYKQYKKLTFKKSWILLLILFFIIFFFTKIVNTKDS